MDDLTGRFIDDNTWVRQVTVVLFGAVPVSLLVTFVAMRIWSWFEASFGLASVSHSGLLHGALLSFTPS